MLTCIFQKDGLVLENGLGPMAMGTLSTGVPPLMHTVGSSGRVSKHGIMHLGR
jgi:hypothetical protein